MTLSLQRLCKRRKEKKEFLKTPREKGIFSRDLKATVDKSLRI